MAKATLFLYLFSVVLLELTLGSDDVRSKIVKTTSGPVKGYKSPNGDFFSFFGVPYATAPTGADKFKGPLPAPVWLEPLEAITENIYCPQVTYPSHWAIAIKYQEDCLVANIFVPDTDKTDLPVVVYIHGGAFQIGNGNLLRPYEFMNEAEDIIVVNFNYRLGVLGFLCLGTEDIPGNAGMRDQVAALRWVKKNIASFGGNADDITLAGYSAGSVSVDLLVLSEITDGLFTKVIPESGVGYASISVQVDPLGNAKEYARQLNYTTDDVYELEEFYKQLPYEQMTSISLTQRYDNDVMFVPCIERDLGQEVFLKQAPVDIVKEGNFKKLPTLIGFSSLEGILRADVFDDWKTVMNEDFTKFLPTDLQFKDEEEKQSVALQIKQYYFGDKDIDEESLESYFSFMGDTMFAYPTVREVKLQVLAGNHDIYLYQFSYVDDGILSTHKYPEVRGANHCSQSYTVLEKPGAAFGLKFPVSEDYKKMKSITRKVWIKFIKTGAPVPKFPVVTEDFPLGWPQTSHHASPHVDLNLPTELKGALLQEKVEFWDSIYEKYYRKPAPPPVLPAKHSEL